MNSTTRVVHDLPVGFHTALGRRLKVCGSTPATMLRETGCIQRAGTSTLDNGLEAEFYGLPEKPITCSWEDASCFRLKHAYAVGDQPFFQRIRARPGQLELSRRTLPAAVDRFVEIPAACRDRQPIEINTAKLRSRV